MYFKVLYYVFVKSYKECTFCNNKLMQGFVIIFIFNIYDILKIIIVYKSWKTVIYDFTMNIWMQTIRSSDSDEPDPAKN